MSSSCFVVTLPENPTDEQMEVFQDFMNAQSDAYFDECDQIAKDLGVSHKYANAICYLRTRSRWTQELEDRLIEMCKAEEPCPNMNDWR